MNMVKIFIPTALIAGFLLMTACSHITSQETSFSRSHPEPLAEGRPLCSDCHDTQLKGTMKPYGVFDHSLSFVKDHRYTVAREDRVCAACHPTSFCTDCHTNETEIKPSTKLGDRPDRELVHRGDFITRHKIEGKLDPASCYRCHGRTNNDRCITCHR